MLCCPPPAHSVHCPALSSVTDCVLVNAVEYLSYLVTRNGIDVLRIPHLFLNRARFRRLTSGPGGGNSESTITDYVVSMLATSGD